MKIIKLKLLKDGSVKVALHDESRDRVVECALEYVSVSTRFTSGSGVVARTGTVELIGTTVGDPCVYDTLADYTAVTEARKQANKAARKAERLMLKQAVLIAEAAVYDDASDADRVNTAVDDIIKLAKRA